MSIWEKTVGTGANSSGGTTVTITPGSTIAAGRTLLLAVTIANGTTGSITASDGHNTYTNRADYTNVGVIRVVIFIAENITSINGSNTITITFGSSSRSSARCESYNTNVPTAFDVVSTTHSGNSTAPLSNTATPSTTRSTAIGVVGVVETSTTFVAGNIFGSAGSLRGETLNGASLALSGATVVEDLDITSTSAGTAAGTITSAQWLAIVIVLKYAALNTLSVSGTIAPVGALTKVTNKKMAGTITSSAVVSLIRLKLISLAGTITSSGTVTNPRAFQPHIKMGFIGTVNHTVSAIVTKITGPSRPKLGG